MSGVRPSPRRVRKRDGREVPFRKEKIEAAVLAAQAAVGEEDKGFAREVSDLVELALRRRYAWTGPRARLEGEALFPGGAAEGEALPPESIPEIEEIQDLVEVGLIELGHAAVAKAYILYRDRRARSRDVLKGSAPSEAAEGPGALRAVQVREAGGTFAWSKERIVAALVHEADLSREDAERIALRVEQRVIDSGMRRLSSGLVRELVDNELVAMGLEGALARHAPVSVPRYDLRQWLEAGSDLTRVDAGVRRGLSEVLGGELLRRYVESELLDAEGREPAASEALHLVDLAAPHQHLVQAVPCELVLRGTPGPHAAFEALEEIAGLCAGVSRGLVLESPSVLLQSLARASRGEGQASLTSWLQALSAVARAAGRRVDLFSAGGRAPALCARLLRELDELQRGGEGEFLARVFADGPELASALEHDPGVREAAERLMGRGQLVPTWSAAGSQRVAPGCSRGAREHGALACGGAVALDLVREAERAGPWREELVLEALAARVEEAVELLAGLAAFQREHRAARSGEARGRVSYALTPVGLREALRILGDGELRAEQGARILGLVGEAARRFSAERGLCVTLTPAFGEEAARRFARAEGPRARQGLLFGGASFEHARRARYTPGYDLGEATGRPGTREAALLSTVPSGIWTPTAASPRAAGPTPHLEAWEGFLAEREAQRRATPRELPVTETTSLFQLDAS